MMIVLVLLVLLGLIAIVAMTRSAGRGSEMPFRMGRLGWRPRDLLNYRGTVLLAGNNRWRHFGLGLHWRTDATGPGTKN